MVVLVVVVAYGCTLVTKGCTVPSYCKIVLVVVVVCSCNDCQ